MKLITIEMLKGYLQDYINSTQYNFITSLIYKYTPPDPLARELIAYCNNPTLLGYKLYDLLLIYLKDRERGHRDSTYGSPLRVLRYQLDSCMRAGRTTEEHLSSLQWMYSKGLLDPSNWETVLAVPREEIRDFYQCLKYLEENFIREKFNLFLAYKNGFKRLMPALREMYNSGDWDDFELVLASPSPEDVLAGLDALRDAELYKDPELRNYVARSEDPQNMADACEKWKKNELDRDYLLMVFNHKDHLAMLDGICTLKAKDDMLDEENLELLQMASDPGEVALTLVEMQRLGVLDADNRDKLRRDLQLKRYNTDATWVIGRLKSAGLLSLPAFNRAMMDDDPAMFSLHASLFKAHHVPLEHLDALSECALPNTAVNLFLQFHKAGILCEATIKLLQACDANLMPKMLNAFAIFSSIALEEALTILQASNPLETAKGLLLLKEKQMQDTHSRNILALAGAPSDMATALMILQREGGYGEEVGKSISAGMKATRSNDNSSNQCWANQFSSTSNKRKHPETAVVQQPPSGVRRTA